MPGAAAPTRVPEGGATKQLAKHGKRRPPKLPRIHPAPPFSFAFPDNDNGERDQAVIEAELAEIHALQEKLEAWDPRSQAMPLRVGRIVSIVK